MSHYSNIAVFRRLGSDTLAPLLQIYVRWLHDQAVADGVTHLLFLARDGYMVQRAYRAVIPIEEQLPNQYMYASRRLFNFAAIRQLDDRALDFLLGDAPVMPVGRYLERAGLDPRNYGVYISRAGFVDGPETVVTPHEALQMRELVVSLEEAILEVTAAERRRLKAYADSLVDWDTAHCGVVDIGWHGSLQASLRNVLGLEADQLHGYYLGLHIGASRRGPDSRQAFLDESRLADFWMYHNTLRRCVEIFELMFAEADGSIIGLREGADGEFEAIRDVGQMPLEAQDCLLVAQAACMEALSAGPARDSRQAMLRRLARLMRRPTADEAAAIGDIVHQEGFGGYGRLEHLARPRYSLQAYLRRPGVLLWDLRKTFWRSGFIVRVLSHRPMGD